MPTYKITVTSTYTFDVSADSEEIACEQALGEVRFQSPEWEVEECEEVESEEGECGSTNFL